MLLYYVHACMTCILYFGMRYFSGDEICRWGGGARVLYYFIGGSKRGGGGVMCSFDAYTLFADSMDHYLKGILLPLYSTNKPHHHHLHHHHHHHHLSVNTRKRHCARAHGFSIAKILTLTLSQPTCSVLPPEPVR